MNAARLARAVCFGVVVLSSATFVEAADPPPAPIPAVTIPSVPAEVVESPYRKLSGLPEGTIVHVPTGVQLKPTELIDLLSRQRIVYVGESHDNLSHHRIQLHIIRALADRLPGKVAVGMEMFQRPAQPQLDRWVAGELDEKTFLTTWYENWSEDYEYYREILAFLRERRIPLLALNASQEIVHGLDHGGRDALSPGERAAIPEIDTTDPFHRSQMEAVFGVHAGGENFDEFYRTMLLWDETMAQTVSEFVTGPEGRDKLLVVLAGGGHVAYGFGIPRRAFRRAPLAYTVVLPHTDIDAAPRDRPHTVMPVNPIALPLPVADIVWATGYEGVKPSKVRLGVGIEPGEGGVVITSVADESAAAQAGLRAGDVIITLDGEPTRKPGDLVRLVRAHKPGDRAGLTIQRGSKTLSITVSWPQ